MSPSIPNHPMASPAPQQPARRRFLLGAAAAATATALPILLTPKLAAAPHHEIVRAFRQTLSPAQRDVVFLPWDDPSRQIVNTLAIRRAPHIGTLFHAQQMPYVWQLWSAMQSETGRPRLIEPLKAEAGGLDGCVLTIYGDPDQGTCQSVISGGHIDLRAGTQQNGSFGDGIAWGHQVGNHQLRVPGNVWAHHSDAVNRLAALLRPDELSRAVCAEPPNELLLQVQGAGGRFDGLSARAMDEPQRAQLCELIATVLASFAPDHAATAMDDIAANGGFEDVHVALYRNFGFYADGTRYGDVPPRQGEQPYFQVWRVEGPGLVLHFQGWPHVHAYLRLTRDPLRQHIGESLAASDRLVEGEELRGFIEGAMRRGMDADLAFMPGDLPARIVPGLVTTGTMFSFDPFANRVVVAEVRGDQLGDAMRRRVDRIEPARLYRIATIDYALDAFTPDLGAILRTENSGQLLRHALIDHLRAGGLGARSA